MQAVRKLLDEGLGLVYTAAQVEIRRRGGVIFGMALGTTDTEGRLHHPKATPVRRGTPFDFASLTKLFITSAFLRLVDAGHVRLDTPVAEKLPEFTGLRPICPYDAPLAPGEVIHVVPPTEDRVDAGAVTFRHLLTHSSGLPAWIDLRKAADAPARQTMIVDTFFSYPTGTQVVYSDVGYMILGLAIERMTGAPLRESVKRLVMRPLELDARYGPVHNMLPPPTELCQWRRKRVQGEVHDENTAVLGGVSGHAGLFGTATDVAILAQTYLDGGGGFLSSRLAREAIRPQIGDRGLGWMMRSPEASSSGAFFGPRSFGHTGFVGNSVWVDPDRELVAVLLTNAVFFGRARTGIIALRPHFHDAVIRALEG